MSTCNLTQRCCEVEDPTAEIDLLTAQNYNRLMKSALFDEDVTPQDFNRVGAQAAKQAVMQRSAMLNARFATISLPKGKVLTGIIDRIDHRFVYMQLGKTDAVRQNRNV